MDWRKGGVEVVAKSGSRIRESSMTMGILRSYGLVRRTWVLAAAGAILLIPACSSSDDRVASGSQGGTSESPRAGDSCSIATPEEISQAAGANITTAQVGTPDGPIGCSYDGDTWVQVTVYNRRAAFDQRQASQCESSSHPVSDLGMQAVDCSPDLFVLVDAERGFLVAVGSDLDADGREAIGRLVAPRIAAMP